MVALCDFLSRRFRAALASCPTAHEHGVRFDYTCGQFCLETNRARVFPATGTVCVIFELVAAAADRPRHSGKGASNGSVGDCESVAESVKRVIKRALLSRDRPGGGLDAGAARAHVEVGFFGGETGA